MARAERVGEERFEQKDRAGGLNLSDEAGTVCERAAGTIRERAAGTLCERAANIIRKRATGTMCERAAVGCPLLRPWMVLARFTVMQENRRGR